MHIAQYISQKISGDLIIAADCEINPFIKLSGMVYKAIIEHFDMLK